MTSLWSLWWPMDIMCVYFCCDFVPCMIIGCCHRYSSPLLMKAEQCPSIETQHLIYCCSLDGCAGSCESHRPAGWFVRPERLWQWRLVFLYRGECMSGDHKLCTTVIYSYILALLEELWHLRVPMNMLFGKNFLLESLNFLVCALACIIEGRDFFCCWMWKASMDQILRWFEYIREELESMTFLIAECRTEATNLASVNKHNNSRGECVRCFYWINSCFFLSCYSSLWGSSSSQPYL
jgi:hypothetical protein